MRNITLTERQKEIVDFIREYRQRRGISPTQREICDRFGFSSFGTLQKHIRLLLEKGVLVRDWNKRRSLLVAEELPEGSALAVELPLVGRIAAGSPIESLSGQERVAVPELLTHHRGNFVLRVRGDSMIGEGIFDGDYVVLEPREEAARGETVAALVRGEATLKKYFPESDGTVRLVPANPEMATIVEPATDVVVQGVVVGLMRRYR